MAYILEYYLNLKLILMSVFLEKFEVKTMLVNEQKNGVIW